MKKTYQTPTMLAVALQHQSHILEASITDIGGNGPGYGGADDPSTGGGDVKGSTNVWDEEW